MYMYICMSWHLCSARGFATREFIPVPFWLWKLLVFIQRKVLTFSGNLAPIAAVLRLVGVMVWANKMFGHLAIGPWLKVGSSSYTSLQSLWLQVQDLRFLPRFGVAPISAAL